jgi:transcriptional regulator with XRE-family HTH domain
MKSSDILRLRKKLGLTQKALGEKLRYAHPQERVSELECGVVSVSPRVAALCDYLEKEFDEAARDMTHRNGKRELMGGLKVRVRR